MSKHIPVREARGGGRPHINQVADQVSDSIMDSQALIRDLRRAAIFVTHLADQVQEQLRQTQQQLFPQTQLRAS